MDSVCLGSWIVMCNIKTMKLKFIFKNNIYMKLQHCELVAWLY